MWNICTVHVKYVATDISRKTGLLSLMGQHLVDGGGGDE